MFSKFQTSHLLENLSFAAEQQSHILQSMNSREPQGQAPHRILPGPESETIRQAYVVGVRIRYPAVLVFIASSIMNRVREMDPSSIIVPEELQRGKYL
mmetsp:Transcript_8188/g.20082  ORF Transcript_8188/g.20082 Transcript_8188/m.20082 type:complete len:98 (-) Transcript_8188:81-374(-)